MKHLKRLKYSVIRTIVIIVILGLGFKFTPTSFLPEEDQGIIFGDIQLDNTSSINQTNKILSEIGEKVRKIEGVKYFAFSII